MSRQLNKNQIHKKKKKPGGNFRLRRNSSLFFQSSLLRCIIICRVCVLEWRVREKRNTWVCLPSSYFIFYFFFLFLRHGSSSPISLLLRVCTAKWHPVFFLFTIGGLRPRIVFCFLEPREKSYWHLIPRPCCCCSLPHGRNVNNMSARGGI